MMSTPWGRYAGWCAALSSAAAITVVSGCGKSDAPFGSGQTTTGVAGGGAAAGGHHAAGGGTSTGTGTGLGTGGFTCAAEAYPAEPGRLDLFFLVDQSASMTEQNRWQTMRTALEAFTEAPTSAGIGVALQLFPQPPSQDIPTTCDPSSSICGIYGPCSSLMGYVCLGSLSPNTSCIPSDYAPPPLDFTPLPGAAAPFNAELTDATPPSGEATPTLIAMQAAIGHCAPWAASNPGHLVDIVLATDGEPTGCVGADQQNPVNSVDAVAAAAQSAAQGDPPIRTFVIGVGYADSDLDEIAAAGGTGQAYHIDTGGAATQQLLQALDEIAVRGECRFELPASTQGTPDYASTLVETVLTSDPTQTEIIGRVASQDVCHPTDGGWSYDDPNDPALVLLCPASCQDVIAGTRNVRIVVPCIE